VVSKTKYVIGLIIILSGVSYLLISNFKNRSGIPEIVEYSFHVRPILSDKCFACHGPDANKRKSDLRLDTPEGPYALLKNSQNRYVISPGDIDHSELYLRISAVDTSDLMPPPSSNLSLSETEIAIIKKWIDQGAEYQPHWSFTLPFKSDPPDMDWATNEIDRFIYRRMRQEGLKPNKEADPERLLKRVSFDLTGLPPSLELQDRFLKNDQLEAYEKIVDELIASNQYGERMAISWLDVARYADSHGYQDDGLRTMWPWRDWVIHAFNSNYPYDKFITMQLAGDLFLEPSKEDILATGFNRNHKITQEGGVIDEEYRVEYVTDRTNTFGKAFLGLTFECAKCHDHKFDPISMEEYYGTFSFFDKVPEKGLLGDIQLASLADPPAMDITDEDVAQMLQFINKKDTGIVSVMIMKDSIGLRDTYILTRGNYDAKGAVVTATTPKQILPFDTSKFERNRAGLAKWLTDDENPLTSRVFVNRMWNQIFGRGIVATTGDFGMQGELPSHPELLDWLAVDFKENNWDIKRLVKQMVMSSTYRQSGVVQAKKLKRDPENIFLSRMSRTRFNAEIVRDHILASSGLLNKEIGGPSVKPYQPEGLWDAATSGRGVLKKYIQDHNEDLYRRGMYTFIKRTVPPPSMLMFDASNRDQCEVQRSLTNTPLQALVMLNDPTVLEASRVLSERLLQSYDTDQKRVDEAFRLIVCRKMKAEEELSLNEYYASERKIFEDEQKAEKFVNVGEYPMLTESDPKEVAALMQVILLMYNLEEATSRS